MELPVAISKTPFDGNELSRTMGGRERTVTNHFLRSHWCYLSQLQKRLSMVTNCDAPATNSKNLQKDGVLKACKITSVSDTNSAICRSIFFWNSSWPWCSAALCLSSATCLARGALYSYRASARLDNLTQSTFQNFLKNIESQRRRLYILITSITMTA